MKAKIYKQNLTPRKGNFVLVVVNLALFVLFPMFTSCSTDETQTVANFTELVMQDEFDTETPDIVREGAGELRVRGIIPIAKLAELIGEPVKARGVDTVGGLIALRLGRVPAQGDRVELGNATLEVEDVRHNRAGWVRVVMRTPTDRETVSRFDDRDTTGDTGYD